MCLFVCLSLPFSNCYEMSTDPNKLNLTSKYMNESNINRHKNLANWNIRNKRQLLIKIEKHATLN